MIIALDIDDTITALPAMFAALSQSPDVNRVIIVTTRSDNTETRIATEKELAEYGINYDSLFMLSSFEVMGDSCPYDDLDWYQKYLWQKVQICLNERVDVVFDDDDKVIDLFKRFAPEIRAIQVHK